MSRPGSDPIASQLSRSLGRTDITPHVNTSNPDTPSYAVGQDLWVKVASDARKARALDRWARVAGLLESSYAAPRLVDRLVVDDRPALVFERLHATSADQNAIESLMADLLALTGRLHADRELGASVDTGPVTAAQSLDDLWGRRLRADLDIVDGSTEAPGRDVVDAWRRELAHLAELVQAHEEPVSSPVHRDLWRENVLVGDDRFWLIDWDGLSLGDPVVDDAVLLFDALGADLDAWADARPPRDAAEADRFALCLRFQLLDRAIDPLADNVALPSTGYDEVKQAKRVETSRAWSLYLDEFA